MTLDDDDLIRADLLQRLMCNGAIDIAAFETRHRIDFAVYFASDIARLRALVADGLVLLSPQRIAVTARGRLLLRVIAMCFDAHLARARDADVRYSKAL
jgi:oxygen-independent coproporphyrinogen-3 oxidase